MPEALDEGVPDYSITARALQVQHHLATGQGTFSPPPPTVGGNGANISATSMAAGSTDMAGKVSITSGGTAPASGTQVCTVTFGQAYGTAPVVSVDPQSANMAGVPLAAVPTTTGFAIVIGAAMAASITGTVGYQVIGLQP